MWKRLVWPILLVCLQAGAGAGTQLFRDPNPWFDRSVLALFVITVLSAAVTARTSYLSEKASFAGDIERALLVALAAIVSRTKLSEKKIGLNCYRTAGVFRKKQIRIARVRLSNRVPPSTVVWTETKGVIGLCWQHENHAQYWRRSYLTATAWDEVEETNRLGFTSKEWGVALRYAGIIVVPIIGKNGDQYKYLGCVSLDFDEDQDYVGATETDEVEELLLDAAAGIRVRFAVTDA